jgi:succinyl-diaminopimelate desuccinylase
MNGSLTDRNAAERVEETALRLIDVPSVSGDEAAVLDRIRAEVPATSFVLEDDQDTCLLYLPMRRIPAAPLVLFAGHVDTVPIAGNVPGSIRDGEVVGRGASDMKGALAVMVHVMRALAEDRVAIDIDAAFLFFGREEIDPSALQPLLGRTAALDDVALALVMEPTDNALEIGCLGNLNATVTVHGAAAHSARPWLGDNAIHEGLKALASLADLPIRDVDVGGLNYREVINVTTIAGGVAANVIPDRLDATINFRYAPTHSPEEAERRIRELLGHHRLEVRVVSNSPPGPVAVDNPLVRRLGDRAQLPVRPKQAWTPVAEFAESGIDAVNFGPGDPRYAHADDERVSVSALRRSYELCTAFLAAEST